MKKFLISVVLLVVSPMVLSADMILPIRGIADGDTIRSTLKLPCPLCNVSIRILNIDTPESNYLAKCEKEKELGIKAKAALMELASGHTTMIVRGVRWDKYGGRINGHVEINGTDVGKYLIEQGLAAPYTGRGPKPNWCG